MIIYWHMYLLSSAVLNTMAAGLLALSKLDHDRRGVKLNMEIQYDTGQMPSAVGTPQPALSSLDNKHSLGVTLLQITQCFREHSTAPCRDPANRAHLKPWSSADHEYLLCPAETKPAEPKIHSRKERWLQMTNQLKGLSSLLLIPDATFKNWRVTLRFQQHAATCPTSSEASFWHYYNCFAAMCFQLRTFNSFLFLCNEMKGFILDAVGQWVQNHQCVGDVAAKLSTVTPMGFD